MIQTTAQIAQCSPTAQVSMPSKNGTGYIIQTSWPRFQQKRRFKWVTLLKNCSSVAPLMVSLVVQGELNFKYFFKIFYIATTNIIAIYLNYLYLLVSLKEPNVNPESWRKLYDERDYILYKL